MLLKNLGHKNFIALAFVLMLIFCTVYALMRVAMVRNNIESANFLSSDLVQMFIMGVRFDMRVVCIFVAFVVIISYAANVNRAIFVKITKGGGGRMKNATPAKIAPKKSRESFINLHLF